MTIMSVVRVLDANINRAAEGMRVLEDISRFVLENKELCITIKNCRHSLREQSPTIHSRNTGTDVGTSLTAVQEYKRGSIHDIATAAGNRCAEALRVIEEFLKLRGTENKIESIRYKMYDVSAEIIRRLGSTNKKQWKLCFVMTKDECLLPWQETLQQAIESGCDCVQLREKNKSTAEMIQHAFSVKKLVEAYHTPVIINDRVDVMLSTNASGVHLGENDMSVQDARKVIGSQYIIGATVHTAESVNKALESGADYVGVGAMFPSETKPNVPVASFALLDSVQCCNHLAIGGITTKNVHELYSAGCRGIAVSSAIARSTTPGKIVENLLQPEAQLI